MHVNAGSSGLMPTIKNDWLVLVDAEGLVPSRGSGLYRRVVAIHAAGLAFRRTICEGGVGCACCDARGLPSHHL